jgi:antibiotic biosynthesis monooxygenase (ABM) superfamily enzyme
VVVSRRARPGREAELVRWAAEVTAAASAFPGHLGAQVYEPAPPDHEDLVIVFGFATAEQLARWERSPERTGLIRRADELSVGTQHAHTLETLATLFSAPGTAAVAPPRWKTATVIALAIYPLTLLVALLVSPHLSSLPVPLRSLATTVLIVPLMTWVAVPAVSRLLGGWLRRR